MADVFGDPDFAARAARIPIGRAGLGEDIGWAAVYLCSDQGSWITGQSINVCGGNAVAH